MKSKKIIYAGMVADLIHHGHMNLIKQAANYGTLMVGVLSDEAVESYKRKPILQYKFRKKIVENIKGVDKVVKQDTLSYKTNLLKYKPNFVINGDDWRKGVQKETRAEVIKCLRQWNGRLIEIEYTKGISTSLIINRILKASQN